MSIDPIFNDLVPILQAITDRRPRIVEIGVHWGETSGLLIGVCRVPPIWQGFEPDPRNLEVLEGVGLRVQPFAISDHDGTDELWLSSGKTPDCGTREHTDSSSLCRPTRHLEVHPWCRFDERAEVKVRRLDSLISDPIDLIWADVQGAQRQVLAGATECLRRTRYLYIECHSEPMYEGEPTFDELLALLPGWICLRRYPNDALFENPRAR